MESVYSFKGPLLDLKHGLGLTTSQLASHIGFPDDLLRIILFGWKDRRRLTQPLSDEHMEILRRVANGEFTPIKDLPTNGHCSTSTVGLEVSTAGPAPPEVPLPEPEFSQTLPEENEQVFAGTLNECWLHYQSQKLNSGDARQVLIKTLGVDVHTLRRWEAKGLPQGRSKNPAKLSLFLAGQGYVISDAVEDRASSEHVDNEEADESVRQRGDSSADKVVIRVGSAEHLGDSIRALINALKPLADHALSSKFGEKERRELRRIIGKDDLFELANMLNALCSEHTRKVYLQK